VIVSRLDEVAQLKEILAHNLAHLRQLAQIMPVMVMEHAGGTHQLVTLLTEVLYGSIGVLRAVHSENLVFWPHLLPLLAASYAACLPWAQIIRHLRYVCLLLRGGI